MATKEFEWKPDNSPQMQIDGELVAITEITIDHLLRDPAVVGDVCARVRLAGFADADLELWAARAARRKRLDCTLRKLGFEYSGRALIETLDREGMVYLVFTGPVKCVRT